jgi:hypothetical protein
MVAAQAGKESEARGFSGAIVEIRLGSQQSRDSASPTRHRFCGCRNRLERWSTVSGAVAKKW